MGRNKRKRSERTEHLLGAIRDAATEIVDRAGELGLTFDTLHEAVKRRLPDRTDISRTAVQAHYQYLWHVYAVSAVQGWKELTDAVERHVRVHQQDGATAYLRWVADHSRLYEAMFDLKVWSKDSPAREQLVAHRHHLQRLLRNHCRLESVPRRLAPSLQTQLIGSLLHGMAVSISLPTLDDGAKEIAAGARDHPVFALLEALKPVSGDASNAAEAEVNSTARELTALALRIVELTAHLTEAEHS